MACTEITPDDFDDMHHALGRPDLETLLEGENYRNFYATEAGSAWAQRAESMGMWDRVWHQRSGIVTYRLNGDGKSALADWLRLQQAAPDPGRPVPPHGSGGGEPPPRKPGPWREP
jgi:hypothetical protein